MGGATSAGRSGGGLAGVMDWKGQGGPFGEQGLVGGAFGPILGSNEPRQFQRQYTMTDPFQNLKPQQAELEALLARRAGQGPMGVRNPYVGPRPEQSRAIESLEQYRGQAEPFYETGVGTLNRTAGGGFLDVAANPQFKALSDARMNLARSLFSDFAPEYSSSAGARGVPAGSARLAGVQRGGERIATQAAQDIAQAGWGQYGAERGLMQQAAQTGTQLAPGLAGQTFNAGEQLRSAQQAGNLAQIEGQLRAAGLSQVDVQNALRYMQLASGTPLPSYVAPSAQESNVSSIGGLTSAFGNLFGGGK